MPKPEMELQKDRHQTTKSRYGRIAAVYELGAQLGSGGQILASKKHHLTAISKPSRILYPGAGWGTEAALAAKLGHTVTVVDLDPAMMERAQNHFRQQGVEGQIETILGSITDFDRPGEYDVIVINYLLDVFNHEVMLTIYEHLVRQAKTGGLVTFAGYAPLSGSWFHQALQYINHAYANLFCAITVNNAIHGIYNYGRYFDRFGLRPLAEKEFPMFGHFGPRFLKTWIAQKV